MTNTQQKKRILWVGEASPLSTGFAQYYNYLLKLIYETGKFEIAEFGSYIPQNDLRVSKVQWKFYGNMPDIVGKEGKDLVLDAAQNAQYEKDYKLNQFGKWRFDEVVADFKPDFVVAIRDHWMDEWILRSPFRRFFKFIWMPTVDGDPQDAQWLKDYALCDGLFTYSQYGKKVLESESGGALKVLGVPSPGVDTDIFRPLNKEATKKKLGLPSNSTIIGTVMRNQPRKLFCELILSFKSLLERCISKYKQDGDFTKAIEFPVLYLHTGIPDVGWNIPLEIERNHLQKYVYVSYYCPKCKRVFASNWYGETVPCINLACGNKECRTPNTNIGVEPKDLALVYNAMDVYVQLSVCEGWGLPIPEAKACGVPVFGTDCTAISEQVRDIGCKPIKVKTTFTDNGTLQRRSLPDTEALTDQLFDFINGPLLGDKKVAAELRESVMNSWQRASDIWTNYFDTESIQDRSKTWNSPIEIVDVKEFKINPLLSFTENVASMYTDILKLPPNFSVIHQLEQRGATPELILKDFTRRVAKKNQLERLRGWGCPSQKEIASEMDPTDTFRILYVMPRSAGDVLMSTGVVKALKKKYPKASIYFATEPAYASILEGNPDIKKILPFDKELLNYQLTEGCAQDKGDFNITFCPFIVTQTIPHVWHNGHGADMIATYGNMCDVIPEPVWIGRDSSLIPDGPYITVHTGSSQEIKNYDFFDDVMLYCKAKIVQVGSKDDPLINVTGVLDLRDKTTPQQLASIIENSLLHVGVDSFPAHIAGAVGTDVVTLFGSTFSNKCKARPSIDKHSVSIAIEPINRWKCSKPCHLIQCTQQSKCINNIKPYDDVVEPLALAYPHIFSRIEND